MLLSTFDAVLDPTAFGMFLRIPKAFQAPPLTVDQLNLFGDCQITILDLMPVPSTGVTSVVVVFLALEWTSFDSRSNDISGAYQGFV